MANSITTMLKIGTVGELLVQLRFLQYGVQSAPPLKDSGNDLIALKGFMIHCVQVKTSTGKLPVWPPESKKYHILALVKLVIINQELQLDESKIYLFRKEDLHNVTRKWAALAQYELNDNRISQMFNE